MPKYPEACYAGTHVSGCGYTECCSNCGYNVYGPPPSRDGTPPYTPPPPSGWNGCTPDSHIGPVQQYTEHCLNCGRNIYS